MILYNRKDRAYPRRTPMETPGTDWATSAVIVRTRTERTMEMYRRAHHLVIFMTPSPEKVSRRIFSRGTNHVESTIPVDSKNSTNLTFYQSSTSPLSRNSNPGLVPNSWLPGSRGVSRRQKTGRKSNLLNLLSPRYKCVFKSSKHETIG